METNLSSLRIRELLNQHCMSAQDLSTKSGVSKASISQYLSGLYTPKNTSAKKIADVFNVNPAWIMGLDVPMEIEHLKPITTVQVNNEFIAYQGDLDYIIKQVNKLSSPELEALQKYVDFALSVKKIKEKEDLEVGL